MWFEGQWPAREECMWREWKSWPRPAAMAERQRAFAEFESKKETLSSDTCDLQLNFYTAWWPFVRMFYLSLQTQFLWGPELYQSSCLQDNILAQGFVQSKYSESRIYLWTVSEGKGWQLNRFCALHNPNLCWNLGLSRGLHLHLEEYEDAVLYLSRVLLEHCSIAFDLKTRNYLSKKTKQKISNAIPSLLPRSLCCLTHFGQGITDVSFTLWHPLDFHNRH